MLGCLENYTMTHTHHPAVSRATAHGQTKHYYLEDVLSRWRGAHVKQFIPAQSIVCDVGCGYKGNFLFSLANEVDAGYGFDIAVDANMSTDTIHLQSVDINQSIPLADNSVDIVTSLAVLEHLSNRVDHLREIYRILKPGGNLLLTTPTPKNKPLLEFLAFRLHVTDATEIADHKCYLTDNELRTILINAGFADTNIITRMWQLGLNNSVRAKK